MKRIQPIASLEMLDDEAAIECLWCDEEMPPAHDPLSLLARQPSSELSVVEWRVYWF